jgi:heptosyltransferase-3
MKILIQQLARFGDIYSSWPAINAFKRRYPNCEIHLLVRARFKEATAFLTSVDKVHVLETANVLEPLFHSSQDLAGSLMRLQSFVTGLQHEKYDKIINLTFSPFSSYLTSLLKTDENAVVGYHRFSDGHLALADDWSCYFYAQVGIGKANRIHLTDIFAEMLGVSIEEADWQLPQLPASQVEPPSSPYLVVHLGASQKSKAYPASLWLQALIKITSSWKGSVVLIGSAEEAPLAQQITEGLQDRVIDFIGKTKLTDLFSLLKGAEMLIGADSAPVHIASLVNTLTLNLSCSNVNLWETGPRAPGSRILFSNFIGDILPVVVASEALSVLSGEGPLYCQYYINSQRQCLSLKEKRQNLDWSLIEFLYFSGRAPTSADLNYASALVHVYDVTQLAIEQLYNIQRNSQDKIAQAVLEKTDEILSSIPRLVPELAVLIRWFQAEKTRIPPSGFISVLEKTFMCYRALSEATTQLQLNINLSSYGGGHGATELERS